MTTVTVHDYSASTGSAGGIASKSTASYSSGSLRELVVYSSTTDRWKRTRWVLISCVISSAICLVTLSLGLAAAAGVFYVAPPLFWFPITVGSLGVSGSTYISIGRLWTKQRT